MTTSNAAVDSASKAGAEKHNEKLAEKRRALGRGLESLLPGPRAVSTAPTHSQQTRVGGAPDVNDFGSQPSPHSTDVSDGTPGAIDQIQAAASEFTGVGEPVYELAIEQIDRNPYQTRMLFDEAALKELSDSIAVQGVLQPIVVRAGTDGRFILMLGERRLRASLMAGKTTIPAIVKRVSDQQAAEMTLVENLQRQDLSCVDQAAAFARLSTDFKLTQEQIGIRVGLSREQVSNYMRLLNLPEGVIGALQKGTLTYSHARTLLRLRDNVQIWRLAQKVIEQKMSVQKLEDLVLGVSGYGGSQPRKEGVARWVDPNVKAAQRSLEEMLGMKVRIRAQGSRGKILIEYATLDDFERVVTMLKGK